MKHLKQIISQITQQKDESPSDELLKLIWRFICYPPKMPLRAYQEELLARADKFSVNVHDQYFTHVDLNINGFVWGDGKNKILITHGWGSKAADFGDVINALLQIPDVQVISFDAPANGSSDGDLSNLLLFVQAIVAVIHKTGRPDVIIGHSLGAMANVIAAKQLDLAPQLLVSITPLIKLKENFEASMSAVGLSPEAQQIFLADFERIYGFSPSVFNMNDQYWFDVSLNHWLVYDKGDLISPYIYMEGFLSGHPTVKTLECNGAGHDRVIKSEAMIAGLVEQIKLIL